MIRQQRHARILEIVRERKACTVEELRKELDVSHVTLYRDLKELDRENVIQRVHGGVIYPVATRVESRFNVRLQTQTEQKTKIGRQAAERVEPGWAIFLDASSTCYLFARQLVARRVPGLTVVTNSPQIPLELEAHPDIRVISTGGELLHVLNAFAGPLTMELLFRLHFDAAFLSCGGITLADGATTDSPLLAEISKRAAAHSRHIYLLADSSKFTRRLMITGLELESIQHIVTDSGVSADQARRFRDRGVQFTVV